MNTEELALSPHRPARLSTGLLVWGIVLASLALRSSVLFYQPPEPAWPRPGNPPAKPSSTPSPMPIMLSLILFRCARLNRKRPD